MAETTAFIVILEKPVGSEYAAEVAKGLQLMVRDCIEVRLVPHSIDQAIADSRARHELGVKLIEVYKELTRMK